MSLKKRAEKVVSPVIGRYTDIEIEHAKGVHLLSKHNSPYLDFSSGIAVNNTGHCHPKVVEAIRKQAGEMIHVCAGIGYYKQYIEVCEKLKEITPGDLEVSFLCQSGTEAVEAAIKLAKCASGRQGIISFKGAFHGRSLGALSVTSSKESFRKPYEPLLPNVYFAPYAYCYRCTIGKKPKDKNRPLPPSCGFPCLAETEKLIKKVGTKQIGAMIVEPIQGENGYIIPPQQFIVGLRKLCNKYKILMIADEIQTGFGRTGKMFAVEHFGIVPDIMCLAKGIASGLPLGAIIAKKEIMHKWPTGSHGGTMGGNPVCCAAALATFEVLKKEKLVENSHKLGKHLLKKLKKMKDHYRVIGEVRGLGLMAAVEFVKLPDEWLSSDAESQIPPPNPEFVKKILKYCVENKLILISGGEFAQTIRFVPPLIVSQNQVDAALVIFESALRASLK